MSVDPTKLSRVRKPQFTPAEVAKYQRTLLEAKKFRADRVARYRVRQGRVNESGLQAAIARWGRLHGFLVTKLRASGRRGVPDLLLIAPNGVIAFVEVKVPSGKTHPLQHDYIGKLRQRGARAEIIDRLDDAITLMLEMLETP
jgi:hypothetical protein